MYCRFSSYSPSKRGISLLLLLVWTLEESKSLTIEKVSLIGNLSQKICFLVIFIPDMKVQNRFIQISCKNPPDIHQYLINLHRDVFKVQFRSSFELFLNHSQWSLNHHYTFFS